jgi:ABC-type multidrug transport system fused ATPase/permease subunit
MTTRLRSWWQKRSKPLIVVAITILVVGVLTLVIFGYLLRLAWTGFFNKTLWDWLQLLIVPLVLAVIALTFQFANSRTEQQIAKQRYEQDQQIALDKQREDLLQTYLDRMSELLLKEKLRSSEVDDEVGKVARVDAIPNFV